MGGAFYRLHPDDFRLRARFGEFEETVDWPYSYDDLEPYYGIAEREIGVSGAGGTNPYEGPRSSEYPMPPLANLAFATRFDAACRHLGLHPFPTPRAVNSIPYNGRPACEYCAFCAGYGCHVGARGSTQEALLPRAVGTRRCEVRSGAMVREVTVGADRRATGCLYVDDLGVIHRVRARVVCGCCSCRRRPRSRMAWPTEQAWSDGTCSFTLARMDGESVGLPTCSASAGHEGCYCGRSPTFTSCRRARPYIRKVDSIASSSRPFTRSRLRSTSPWKVTRRYGDTH